MNGPKRSKSSEAGRTPAQSQEGRMSAADVFELWLEKLTAAGESLFAWCSKGA